MSLNHLVLVLNAAYEPIDIVHAKRALTLVFAGKAAVQEPSDYFVRTPRINVQIPSVIRFLEYRKVPRQKRTVSRKNILLRDRLQCQYCLKPFLPRQLTLDHVIPRSRGGQNTWENLVASCYNCNHKKRDRTPSEAGMPLIHKPAPIGIHARHRLLLGDAKQPVWDQYLFV